MLNSILGMTFQDKILTLIIILAIIGCAYVTTKLVVEEEESDKKND